MRYLICLLVSVLMIGCSCSEKAEETIAEKIAEKALELQIGNKADIKVDEEGLQIKTKDGEMSITSGKSAKIPDNFPKDIPVYDAIVLEMAMEVPSGYALSFTTKDDVTKVSEWYLSEMTGEGWTKETSMDMGNQKMLVFKKGQRGVNFVASPDNDLTRISLTSVKE